MRIVLEWLGLVEPDRGRRAPVAVPAWAPYATAAVITAAIAALAEGLSLLARALVR